MRKYTLSEEIRMYEKVLGIDKKKPEPCPFCSLPVDESDSSKKEEEVGDQDK